MAGDFPTLHTSEWLWGVFSLSLLIAFRRLRNLRDLLVRATLNVTCHEMPGNCPCRAAGFKMCSIFMTTNEFTSRMSGQNFKKKFATSSKSANIVYLITCRRCGQQHVGESGQPLHCRINTHYHNIMIGGLKNPPWQNTLLAMDTLKQTWLWRYLCKIQESRWIRTLGTSYPSGMNLRVNSLWSLPDVIPLTLCISSVPPLALKLPTGASCELITVGRKNKSDDIFQVK